MQGTRNDEEYSTEGEVIFLSTRKETNSLWQKLSTEITFKHMFPCSNMEIIEYLNTNITGTENIKLKTKLRGL
jgi:hypothetical protein